jgi:aspartyl-tRNA(Asn)/glutamyl-tRNA(Gln) amidotransferase subunit A
VAAGLVPLATASDGGGSTRIPASFSGLFGFKPSHGRIAKPSDQASQTSVTGVLTTTVTDAARHLDVTAGPHGADRLSLPAPSVTYETVIESLDVSRLRVGWSADLGFAAVDPEVEDLTRTAAEALAAAAGLALVDVDVRLTDPVQTWSSAGAVDLWLDLEPGMWPDAADDLTLFVRRVLEQTERYPVPSYARALQRRQQLQADCAALFDEVDVLLTPATAVPAFAAEGPPPAQIAGREVTGAMSTPFTMLANLCWNPACSVPAEPTAAGLPVGLQVMGPRHADEVVLRLARLYEQARPWPRLAPATAAATATG